MADDSPPDYKALYLRSEELRRKAEADQNREAELRRQAEADRNREAELRRQAEADQNREAELRRQAEADQNREAELRRQEKRNNEASAFEEFIQGCHNLLSRPLQVADRIKSTQGTISPPTGKYCPTKLRPWTDCLDKQQEIYNSVCRYLQFAEDDAPRLFPSLSELQFLNRRLCGRPLSSEKDLEFYERFAVEDHVRFIIAELCKIPAARHEFQLGDGVWFENHANFLDVDEDEPSNPQKSRPDQFCIHRVDNSSSTLIATVEYKPPHKLTVSNLRVGLRNMELWEEVVNTETIPTDPSEKLKYNAERLAGSALTQEYHVMIQEGLEYSYVTNGFALVLLRVPYEDPSTLYYHLCEPNPDVGEDDNNGRAFRQPKTAVARALCLCLMSFCSPPRSQTWRNAAKDQLHTWNTDFNETWSQIPREERQLPPPNSEYSGSEPSASEYIPSSSSGSPTAEGRRVPTRSQTRCAPWETTQQGEPMDSSDSDSNEAVPGRKRSFSRISSSSSSSAQQLTLQEATYNVSPDQRHQLKKHLFCSQRCLLGLQRGSALDDDCPNVELHRQGQVTNQHPISADSLVQLLSRQLDEDLDHNCTPLGICGSYGAPFKITCVPYGYTVVGKGTTIRLWKEVSREAEMYRVLRKAQGSAVPVFLGAIKLKMTYFLHGAGQIRHMLLMAWGGESTSEFKKSSALHHEKSKSKKEIYELGVVHQDLRPSNMLWNAELGRVLIIDFHRCRLRRRLVGKQKGSLKRKASVQNTGSGDEMTPSSSRVKREI